VNVFFPHRTPYLAQPGCFLLALVGPCVFGTLLPTNPARVATALSQSTKVPPYLTLAGSLLSINTPRLHCRFAKHEQQFPLLFLGAAAAVGSIQRMFHPASNSSLRTEAVTTITIKKCPSLLCTRLRVTKDKSYLWISLAHTPHTKEAFSNLL
jgi:hypothetical protein